MVKCPVSSKAVRASEVITTLRPEGARSENNYLKTHTPVTTTRKEDGEMKTVNSLSSCLLI